MSTDLDGRVRGGEIIPYDDVDIRRLIHTVRNRQVVLDSDLAQSYGVETKVFNQAVKRNEKRFPESFRFRLTEEETDCLRSQIVTSKGRGGRRYLPYAFTEQGIAMLSTVLRSDTAIQISIRMMDQFVAMRHLLADNAALFERMRNLEYSQAKLRDTTDERFDQVFELLGERAEQTQQIFFDGQIFDAFALLVRLVEKAQKNIKLIDGYVDMNTLNILAKKQPGVSAEIYTSGNRLTQNDINTFNAQYPNLSICHTRAFHDRFLILDDTIAYHIGASLKDAGRKCFAINLLQDENLVDLLITHLTELQ